LTALTAVFAAAIGALYASPGPGAANAAQHLELSAATVKRMTDYGSGTLAPWQTLTHGTVGDLLDTPYDGDPQADVLLIGDSITTRSYAGFISAVEAAGHTAAVDYWSGRPTAPAVDRVLSLTTKPKLIVMATGTNDIFDPSVMAAQIARLKAGLPSTTRLMWVDVQISRPGYEVADQRNAMAVNQQIYQAIPKDDVISWASMFWSAPWRIGYYLETDGVHPKIPLGTDFRNAVLMGQVGPALAALS
jgi:hypothetical protein